MWAGWRGVAARREQAGSSASDWYIRCENTTACPASDCGLCERRQLPAGGVFLVTGGRRRCFVSGASAADRYASSGVGD
eukprot:1195572-Prorocentrum_minimum.AAC.2